MEKSHCLEYTPWCCGDPFYCLKRSPVFMSCSCIFWCRSNFLISIGTCCWLPWSWYSEQFVCWNRLVISSNRALKMQLTSHVSWRVQGVDVGTVEEKGKGAGTKSCTGLYSVRCACTSTWKNLFVRRDGELLSFTASATLPCFPSPLVLLPSALQMLTFSR